MKMTNDDCVGMRGNNKRFVIGETHESKQRRLYIYQRAAPSLSLCSAWPWLGEYKSLKKKYCPDRPLHEKKYYKKPSKFKGGSATPARFGIVCTSIGFLFYKKSNLEHQANGM